QRRFARSRQAHDDEDLALVDLERGVDDGRGRTGAQLIALLAGSEPVDGLASALAEDLEQALRAQCDLFAGHRLPGIDVCVGLNRKARWSRARPLHVAGI